MQGVGKVWTDTTGGGVPHLPQAGGDVAAELLRWLAHLSGERRMSPRTVEAHRARLLKKFGAANVAGLLSNVGGIPLATPA